MGFANRIIAALAACIFIAGCCCVARAQDGKKPNSLSVLNYITGWQLDSEGYHPAVFLLVENTSGKDLSGTLIKFQGRFTDLQTAEVTIGRTELRRDLKPHQQFPVSIASGQAFELPREVEMWPRIEAKVMCRVGDVSDEGTETLLIAKIDETARSEEAAFEHLNQATSYAPKNSQARYVAPPKAAPPPVPEKPLLAKARRLNRSPQAKTKCFLLTESNLPGLGDNFYRFEQRFGMPKEYDATHSDWTWARYQDSASGAEVIAGSHDHHGTVEVVALCLNKDMAEDVMKLTVAARSMAGRFKSQSLSQPDKSVRYLPSGRLEVTASSAPAYRVLCMPESAGVDSSLILILAKAPNDPEQLLATQAGKVALLKNFEFLANTRL